MDENTEALHPLAHARARARGPRHALESPCNAAHDLELLEAWQRGDTRACETMMRRYLPLIIRYFQRRAPEHVHDLAQRTAVELLASPERLQPRVSVRAYFLGVASHVLHRHLRDHRREDPAEPSTTSVSTMTSPSENVARAQRREQVRAATASLAPAMRAVVELFYWEQLTTEEISEAVGEPVGTVKWRLAEARAVIARWLEASSRPLDITLRPRRPHKAPIVRPPSRNR